MKIHELKTTKKQNRTRPGRGISAGRGKTAGRGTKGQNSRSGGQRKPGFEGGQIPLYARLPKLRGFKSKKSPIQIVKTSQLQSFKNQIDHRALFEAGLISDMFRAVKVVQKGDLTAKVTVKLDSASEGARNQISKAGGSFTEQSAPNREKQETTNKTK